MKHISKFDKCVYEISYSMCTENGKEYSDDVTLIWRDAPCGVEAAWDNDIPPMELIGWYFGEYDYDDTESYIKEYYEEKLKQKEYNKPKTMHLPICYIHLISDCLETIQKHGLYELLSGYDKNKESIDIARSNLEEVLECLCKPLEELDIDTKIILED